jgi:membrane fusion protein (multidrug efflux system)
VTAGEVLARIDDRDFRNALDQAVSAVASAEAGVRNLDAQLALQDSLIDQAEAGIKANEASAAFAKQDAVRYRDLLKTGYGTVQRAQQSEALARQRAADLEQSKAALVAAHQQIEVLKTERAKAATEFDRSVAVEAQAQLNLGYATITAPIEGTIGARQLRVGQYVQAGTALMAVVPLKAVYVVANFKETQLARVEKGEPVRIRVDSFPGQIVHGHIDSLAPASGLEFALLPPDNATGNFTKIVQRIPVRIAIDPQDPLNGKLRAGMSVEATVDTKSAGNGTHPSTAVATR